MRYNHSWFHNLSRYVTVKPGAQTQAIAGLVKGTPSPPIAALRFPLSGINAFPYEFTVRRYV